MARFGCLRMSAVIAKVDCSNLCRVELYLILMQVDDEPVPALPYRLSSLQGLSSS